MSKKFTALVIGINTLLLVLIFLFGQSIMTALVSNPIPSHPLIVEGFNTFTFVTGPYSAPGATPIPTPSVTHIYWRFYIFAFGLILNVVFIVKTLLTKTSKSASSHS